MNGETRGALLGISAGVVLMLCVLGMAIGSVHTDLLQQKQHCEEKVTGLEARIVDVEREARDAHERCEAMSSACLGRIGRDD